jgi:hypothetical protein
MNPDRMKKNVTAAWPNKVTPPTTLGESSAPPGRVIVT